MVSKWRVHADRFTTNSVTIESDEGQSCLKLLQATKGELMSSLQTIQIPVQKSWICRRFLFIKSLVEIDVSLDSQLLGYVSAGFFLIGLISNT